MSRVIPRVIGGGSLLLDGEVIRWPQLRDPHTLLLLHGESLEDSSVYKVPLTNRGAAVSDAQSKFGGKSLYFDGKSSLFCQMDSIGDTWTVDFWALTSAFAGRYPTLFDLTKDTSYQGMYVQWRQNLISFGRKNHNLNLTYRVNEWHHFALEKTAAECTFYIDGKKKGVTVPEAMDCKYLRIGSLMSELSAGFFTGYIDEFRLSNVIRWAADFTPPTEPYDNLLPIPKPDPHTLLLLHGESVKDSSQYKVPLTNTGVAVSNAQSKFGGKSLYFDGKSRITFPQSAARYGSSDFTIDWWEWAEAGAGMRLMSSFEQWGGLAFGAGGVNLYAGSQPNRWDLVSGFAVMNTTPGTWIHWAIVRKDSRLMSFRNGLKFAETTINGTIWGGTQSQAIGTNDVNQTSAYKGYIDEFRISDVARWDGDFTPPAKPYER